MKKYQFISLLLILVLWCILTYGGLINTSLVPLPHKVIIELWRYYKSGEVISDILPTLKRLFCGLAIGSIIGVSLGLLVGYFTRLYESLGFIIDFLRSIPATALFPIFMLLFGLGESSRIMIIVWGSSFVMLINTVYGVKNSRKIRAMVAKTMGASKFDILAKVVLPDSIPYIATGLRVTVSLALAITVVSEMFIGTNAGLGYRIMESKLLYDIPNVFAALITTGFLGYTLNKILVFFEKRVIHWSGE